MGCIEPDIFFLTGNFYVSKSVEWTKIKIVNIPVKHRMSVYIVYKWMCTYVYVCGCV